MRSIQFDPFGEPVAQADQDERPGIASRIALRSGVGLFWVLVIGIVAARAVYFDPDFAEKFGSVAALMKHVQTILGA